MLFISSISLSLPMKVPLLNVTIRPCKCLNCNTCMFKSFSLIVHSHSCKIPLKVFAACNLKCTNKIWPYKNIRHLKNYQTLPTTVQTSFYLEMFQYLRFYLSFSIYASMQNLKTVHNV